MKTCGCPELPSQTETKASDSMAQDCEEARRGFRGRARAIALVGGVSHVASEPRDRSRRNRAGGVVRGWKGVSCARARFTASRCLSGAARAAAARAGHRLSEDARNMFRA